MKIPKSRVILLLLFLINLAMFLLIVLLGFSINDNLINNISLPERKVNLALLNKDINILNVNSKAFIIYDTQARVVVAGKNENFRFSPASSAKIMSALVVLENFPLDKVLVAENINNAKGSKMYLEEGEEIKVENLLYGMMLPSGNDAAYVLANNFPGGFDKFVDEMNRKAEVLFMKNTRFIDPSGYDDNNYTTAFDLARLGSFAMRNKEFAKIVSTKSLKVTDISGKIEHDLKNLNQLLGINGVNGIKTGFTEEAGGVLVTSLDQGGKNYIIVVLGSGDRFYDTNNIIQNAIKNLELISY